MVLLVSYYPFSKILLQNLRYLLNITTQKHFICFFLTHQNTQIKFLKIVTNWLQGIDQQLGGSNSNISKIDMSTVLYFPATRFPFDEPQLRKMQQQQLTSKELKQAYRNHTIVEIHDIEMKDQSHVPPPTDRLQRPTTLNLSGRIFYLNLTEKYQLNQLIHIEN